MPFRSNRQERWMFANKPKLAKKFVAETPKPLKPAGIELGDYLDKRKKIV